MTLVLAINPLLGGARGGFYKVEKVEEVEEG